MYRLLALILTAVIALPAQTLLAAGTGQSSVAGATGRISGQAFDLSGRQLARATVRLRNMATGLSFGGALSGAAGDFSFSGLRAGNYVVEVGNATGQVTGTSRVIPLTPGQMTATGIGVTAAAEAESAAIGQAGAGSAAGSFFTSTLGIVVIAAVAAGVAVGVWQATKDEASPSR
jgi:Carboxypeptidase regulatory-like domain